MTRTIRTDELLEMATIAMNAKTAYVVEEHHVTNAGNGLFVASIPAQNVTILCQVASDGFEVEVVNWNQ